ncbi:hypothetical protein Tsubulata_051592, partial [Turnera subulata]
VFLDWESVAGWSMIAGDSCGLDSAETSPTKRNGYWVDLESKSRKIRGCFDKFLCCFLKEFRGLDSSFSPLPPMLEDGTNVDLLKLYLVVRGRGGYDAVSANGLWGLVAEESGLGLQSASSVKLVYTKYLDAAEKWLGRAFEGKESLSDSGSNTLCFLKELGAKFKKVLSEVEYSGYLEMKTDLDVSAVVEFNGDGVSVLDDGESLQVDLRKSGIDSVEVGKLANDDLEIATVADSCDGGKNCKVARTKLLSDLTNCQKACDDNDVKSVVMDTSGGKECDKLDRDEEDDEITELDSASFEELISCRKRKRESLSRMLSWVTAVAKSPCDPTVASLPEISMWNYYGDEEPWKQVLLFREALYLKREADSSTGQYSLKKNQKMHPYMYEENFGSSYNLRKKLKPGNASSQPCSQSSSAATQTDLESCTEGSYDDDLATEPSVLDLPIAKRIPVGPDFQAEIPIWMGVASEHDSKWIGTRVWPLESVDRGFIIERDPIGKGRQDSCGCRMPTSADCIRFHCAERKVRLMRELGAAYYLWRFDRMGEEVKLFWTADEEKKFKAIVRSNPPSLDMCFWNVITEVFGYKPREELVSYYYNVFLLQRRAYQNRFTPCNVYSDDDDESEWGSATTGYGHDSVKSQGSLLKSLKKQLKR